jgi:hypothetical protein
VTALAEAEVVPLRYAVEDASLTVTFWPADVVRVKPDVDVLPTVPIDPPSAGPDRALDPPPPDPTPPAEVAAVAEDDVAVAEDDVAKPVETPATATISPAAAIHRLFVFDSRRRTPGWRTDDPDVVLVSWGLVGSWSFMMALLLLLRLLREEWQPFMRGPYKRPLT